MARVSNTIQGCHRVLSIAKEKETILSEVPRVKKL